MHAVQNLTHWSTSRVQLGRRRLLMPLPLPPRNGDINESTRLMLAENWLLSTGLLKLMANSLPVQNLMDGQAIKERDLAAIFETLAPDIAALLSSAAHVCVCVCVCACACACVCVCTV